MRIAYWALYALDRAGHALTWGPFRRYGLVRYRICQAGARIAERLGHEDHYLGPLVQRPDALGDTYTHP